ncbi:FadR/GntR family transcriptional regulator [Desulfococcus sp.]|uniref:FadR/GntR family transcriptional regulator n=1 Tax=Desulfococcus sp. TaxID=2025834 RepID=UPI003593EAF0
MFNPVDGKEITDNIALQIEAAILNNEFKPGEKLPSERDLQNLFQTGRGVIREALRELKQKGLIETRRGGKGGTYVKEVEASEASEGLALLIQQQKIAIENLIEFRESMDRTVTILAISRGKDGEAQALLDLVGELERAGLSDAPDMARIIAVDRELNLRLVKMTRNQMFEWIMRTIQIGFGSYDHILYEDSYYREITIRNWYETAVAISRREPMKALSFIGHHYVMLNRCIQESELKPQ